MLSRWSSLPPLVVGLLLAAPLASPAQPADRRSRTVQPGTIEGLERLVVCHDGAIYRGDLLEYEPKDHITLRLASGKIKRIEWSNVKSSAVVYPGSANPQPTPVETPASQPVAVHVQPPTTPASSTPTPARYLPDWPKEEAKPLDPGLPSDLQQFKKQIATLRVKSNYPEVDVQFLAGSMEVDLSSLTLVPFTTSAEKWKVACEAPCGVPVNKKATFRVVGDEIITSPVFSLPKQGRDFTLYVKGGSKAGRTAAWVMLILGGLSASVSGALLGNSTDSNGITNDTLVKAGWGALGTGAGLMLVSIPLFVTSRTRLSMRTNDKSEVPARAPSSQIGSGDDGAVD